MSPKIMTLLGDSKMLLIINGVLYQVTQCSVGELQKQLFLSQENYLMILGTRQDAFEYSLRGCVETGMDE